MTETANTVPLLLCPSATTIGPDAKVFRVFTGPAIEEIKVDYFPRALLLTPKLLSVAMPAKLAKASHAAASWMDPVLVILPCRGIPPVCLLFRQEVGDACTRCQQVAEPRNLSELQRAVAG